MIVLLATVANAASINGEFEGNPIIKMKADGKVLAVEDVPAILYNGRTMVPIGMLRQLGVGVEWDQATQSANVTLPKITSGEPVDLETIKFYGEVQNLYDRLGILGDMLASLVDRFGTAFDGIQLGRYEILTTLNQQINSVIDNYNGIIKTVDDTTTQLWNKQIYDNDLVNTMDHYNESIDYYKAAETHINNFSSTKKQTDFDNYLEISHQGFLKAHDGLRIASEKEMDYYFLIQNY